ncbi:LamB/YcsF family protein [Amphibacillus jilinensis]|uniref:LamB/YcsF family protein n=1 Tax=Amphibacillus jilinensis TaxID=1216008 RepID=UPI0002D387E6|nr:5-oxoprolinase subunit PxpA [Amphibacillus jilinensis]
MVCIDLNGDLGESFGRYTIGHDQDILPFLSSANIACGFHAADPMVMAKTVRLAERYQVKIGAHPGFPDRVGFGRRVLQASPEEIANDVTYQIGALTAFTQAKKLHHVKPHGALYNVAAQDQRIAKAICEAIKAFDPDLILYGLANSALISEAEAVGLSYAQEVFADRHYHDDGTLVPRSEEDAVIRNEDEVVERVLAMVKEQRVKTINGRWIDLAPDTICLHGDHPHAVQFARKLTDGLKEHHIKIG